MKVKFLAAGRYGIKAKGKMRNIKVFWSTLKESLKRNGHQLVSATEVADVTVLVYNELYDSLDEIDRTIKKLKGIVVHPTKTGRLISDKSRCLDFLREKNIPTPIRIQSSIADVPCLSFVNRSTGKPPLFLSAGESLDKDRHNVSYVDTRKIFNGVEYHTAFRMLCVGEQLITLYPMIGPGLAVHLHDLPIDAGAIQEAVLYANDHLEVANKIARSIGEFLGLGFWSVDMIPDGSGQLYVCEVGIKITTTGGAKHLLPIADKIEGFCGLLDNSYLIKSTMSFAQQLNRWV